MSKTIIAIIILIVVVGLGYWFYQSTITPEELTAKEQACIDSGGQVSTSLCCKATGDFPNLCLIGPCGCSPENSHQVKICECGPDRCFDRNECILSKFTYEDETVDCKTDLDCFIEASRNCDPAKVTYSFTINMFDILITTDTFYEIRGMEANKCVLYLRTEKQDIRFDDKLVQQMLDSGVTEEQIRQQEQEANKQTELVEGKSGICRFNDNDDLTSLLNKTKEGTFSGSVSCNFVGGEWNCTSSGDWIVAECEGEMFSQQVQEIEEKECIFSKDCKEGLHCFKDKCISNDVLKDASKCSPTIECIETCTGCKKETYSCLFSSEEFKNQRCVECFIDMQCKSGYGCEEYKCVKK